LTPIRARCAIRRTVKASTDIIYGLKRRFQASAHFPKFVRHLSSRCRNFK
jgi:hypothetical protein